MSRMLYDADGLVISTYAGPLMTDGTPRKRIQIAGLPDPTTGRRTFVQLGPGQWLSLRVAIEKLGPDCEGDEIA